MQFLYIEVLAQNPKNRAPVVLRFEYRDVSEPKTSVVYCSRSLSF